MKKLVKVILMLLKFQSEVSQKYCDYSRKKVQTWWKASVFPSFLITVGG